MHGRESARSEKGAWTQALGMAVRRIRRAEPLIVISHVPPAGAGDVPTDAYHRGFKGYAWLLRRLEPRLWLHGHTPLASTRDWHVLAGSTEVVNVTGAVLIELMAPGSKSANRQEDGAQEGRESSESNAPDPNATTVGQARD
jgi:hypothetical protein